MQIILTEVKNFGVRYTFDDDVQINLGDNGEVFLIKGHANKEHFELVKKHENIASLYWSELLTDNHEPELIA